MKAKHLFTFRTSLGAILTLIAIAANGQVGLPPVIYQGQLTESNAPANGSYDFETRLFDVPMGGEAIGIVQCNAEPVANGLFALPLNLAGYINPTRSARLFLELSVRPSGSAAEFTTLLPRQRLGAAPYAIEAICALTANSVAFSNITDVPPEVGTTYRAGQGLAEFRPIFNPPLIEFSIAPGGVTTAMLAPVSVTPDRINVSGASAGQVLASDGSKAGWYEPVVIVGDGTLPLSKLSTSNAEQGQVLTFDQGKAGWKEPIIQPLGTEVVGTVNLASNAVTAPKIAPGEIVKSLNGLRDDICLEAGSNVTITARSNNIVITAMPPNIPIPVFFLVVASFGSNIFGSTVEIDHPAINNDPNAMLFVTAVLNPGGAQTGIVNDHPLGVFYDTASNKWSIFNQDGAPMPDRAAFNVMARTQP